MLKLRSHHPVRAIALAVLFLRVAMLQPVLLHPFNRIWTKLGVLLGRLVSPLGTVLLFYCWVAPIGILFRLRICMPWP